MIRSLSLLVLTGVLATCVIGAQPDKNTTLEKAKEKFEKDLSKLDETLVAGIDKAMLQANKANNKALFEKLNYERPLFVTNHVIPTAFPTDNYLQQRHKAILSLQKAYQPAIADLTKAKKLDEAMAVEKSLDGILVANRGYGLAFPDLEMKPQPLFLIENKKTGQFVETKNDDGTGELVLGAKVGRNKPTQCWQIERDDKGFLIRNIKKGDYFVDLFNNTDAGTVISTYGIDRTKEIKDGFFFRMTCQGHDIIIEPAVNTLALATTEKKVKGVTTIYVTQEKKESPPTASQLWTLIEIK